MEAGVNQKPWGCLTSSLRFQSFFVNQTPKRTGAHCQMASQWWNGHDEQICNWGFQEKSLIKVQALMINSEEACGASEI
jgi:hypothetical protein